MEESESFYVDVIKRHRRLRQSEAIRAMVQENWLRVEDLVQPIFVKDGDGPPEEIPSMPNIYRYSIKDLLRECDVLSQLDIRSVALFPCIDNGLKDATGSESLNENGLLVRAIREVKKQVPELSVVVDVALDPYTTHGHDGILNEKGTDVDNDLSVEVFAEMSLLYAEAGVDMVAPSDMMDGRIAAIRTALDESGYLNTCIMSYAVKYNSGYYGPFREAVGSAANAALGNLSKSTYQMNPANRKEAISEALTDVEEGADIVMVKPAGPYLDIIRDIREVVNVPVAAYQVSGEYAQIYAAAQRGWLNLERCREESLMAMKRAGAKMIFTYFAKEQAQVWKGAVV